MRIALLAITGLAACGSVDVPQDRYYRLHYPTPSVQAEAPAGVLRVSRVTLAPHLRGDRIMVGEGPVLMRPYQFHRWAGSLEAMVEDVLVTGFARSRAFAGVKAPGDAGGEALELSGRVLDLQQQVVGGHWMARVTLDLELRERASGDLLFRREFSRDVPVDEPHPESVVASLSTGLSDVVSEVVLQVRELGVEAAATPGR